MPCEKHALAEVGPRGGIKKSPKAPKSGTPIQIQKVKELQKEMLHK